MFDHIRAFVGNQLKCGRSGSLYGPALVSNPDVCLFFLIKGSLIFVEKNFVYFL